MSNENELTAEKRTLIEQHLKHAKITAKKFFHRNLNSGIEEEEFISAAYEALCDCAKRFDFRSGTEFTTFCFPRLRGAMYDVIRFQQGERKRPEPLKTSELEDSEQSATFSRRRVTSLSQFISLADVFGDLGIKIFKTCEDDASVEISYLEAFCPERSIENKKTKHYISKLLEHLPEKQKHLLQLRYYSDLPYQEMSAHFNGRKKSWISRQHSRAIETLRDIIEKEERGCLRKQKQLDSLCLS
jgi:RNA polymerase sigma factor FliA